jgi:hypothetical protein
MIFTEDGFGRQPRPPSVTVIYTRNTPQRQVHSALMLLCHPILKVAQNKVSMNWLLTTFRLRIVPHSLSALLCPGLRNRG